jgi:hypothetical protein
MRALGRRHTLAALAGAVLWAGPSRAEAVPPWNVVRGTLVPRDEPGAFLAATDASLTAFSYGQILLREPTRAPFTFGATLRRLGPDSRSLEVLVPGAVVLVKDGAVALWAQGGDVRFSHDGWRPRPGLRTHDEHRLVVHQEARHVSLSIDGEEASRWELTAPPNGGPVGIGFKGPRAYRSFISVREVRLDAH